MASIAWQWIELSWKKYKIELTKDFLGESMNRLDWNRLSETVDAAAAYDFSNHKVFGSAYYVYQDGFDLRGAMERSRLHRVV